MWVFCARIWHGTFWSGTCTVVYRQVRLQKKKSRSILCSWVHVRRHQGENSRFSFSTSLVHETVHSTNWAVSPRTGQQICSDQWAEWLLIWGGWSLKNVELRTASLSQCGVCLTDWTWWFGTSNKSNISNQFSSFATGLRLDEGSSLTKNGCNWHIQTTVSERSPNHRKRGGRFIMKLLRSCCHRLNKWNGSWEKTEILHNSKPRIGHVRTAFQTCLRLSLVNSLSWRIFSLLFLFSRQSIRQTPNCNSSLFSSLKRGYWFCNLKQTFRRHFDELQTSMFTSFDYLMDLSREQLLSFQVIIERLLLNMEIRFPCPSFSINTQVAKQNINEATKLSTHSSLLRFNKHVRWLKW